VATTARTPSRTERGSVTQVKSLLIGRATERSGGRMAGLWGFGIWTLGFGDLDFGALASGL
jgi:hypothetical protein